MLQTSALDCADSIDSRVRRLEPGITKKRALSVEASLKPRLHTERTNVCNLDYATYSLKAGG